MQQYWGKIIGVSFALMMSAGLGGVVLGLIIGHMFDQARSRKMSWGTDQQKRQALFFDTTFEVMGHLTKSKGLVTEADINIANQLMDRMNLHGESRAAAQNAFRFGKSDNYPLREKIHHFHNACFGRSDLMQMFLEIQIQAALVDGSLHPKELAVLYTIAEELGIFRPQFDQFLHMMHGSAQFGGGYQQQYFAQQEQRGSTLEDAYNVLGVKPIDDAVTVKRAYRRLMSEHHPDKLLAKGLPPEMMEMAKQKTQQIQKAYELIKEQTRFKC